MRMTRVLLAFLLVALVASPSSAASLTLSIQNGLVSLNAQDVTIRQILLEWARVGRTQVVNAERITGGPVTLKFEGVPERQALDIILRAVPGYVAARRETFAADASIYDRILIMPTTSVVAAVRPQPQTPTPGFPGFQGGSNVTQLRPGFGAPGALQGAASEVPDPAADQVNDPAIAAAAAAGLIAVPATSPGPSPVLTPTMPPNRVPAGGINNPPPTVPGSAAPINPWNAPIGTPQPTLAPPAPPTTPPNVRPQPPQADR
jgi:hypothetical protein